VVKSGEISFEIGNSSKLAGVPAVMETQEFHLTLVAQISYDYLLTASGGSVYFCICAR
jgi:hypothetical protein